MAGNITNLYGTSNQSITITAMASLTTNSQASSAAVDNTSNLWQDALVQVSVGSPSASTAATGYVNVYAYGTADGGTTYGGGETNFGTDHTVTLTSPPNIRLIGVINVVANSTTYKGGPFSVAAAFGGVLPAKWGIAVENKTGGTLSASNCSAFYQGVATQYT